MMQESMQLLLIGLLLITATPDRVLLKGKSRGGGVQKTAWEYWEGQKRVIATGCWVAAVTCCSVMLNSCRKDSPSKPSVAELAGRLKGQILPIPNSNDEVPFRRKPPSSLKFQSPEQENDESSKPASPSHIKIKLRNSAMIEKLQANLALSPTSLLPSPKAPEVKLQPTQLSPALACSPLSPPLRPPQPSSEEEDPISFDSPPEGTPLPSFNKTRARLSFKRRPPTRQHRRAAGEEVEAANGQQPPCELDLPRENGDKEQAESGHLGGLKENREEDCEKMEAEETQSDPDERGDLEQEVEQVTPAEALKEDQQPLEQLEGDDETEEQAKTPLEADSGEHGAI